MFSSCLRLNFIKDSIYSANYEFHKHYENMTIQIHWKKFTTKKWKFSDKNSDFFLFLIRIFAARASLSFKEQQARTGNTS